MSLFLFSSHVFLLFLLSLNFFFPHLSCLFLLPSPFSFAFHLFVSLSVSLLFTCLFLSHSPPPLQNFFPSLPHAFSLLPSPLISSSLPSLLLHSFSLSLPSPFLPSSLPCFLTSSSPPLSATLLLLHFLPYFQLLFLPLPSPSIPSTLPSIVKAFPFCWHEMIYYNTRRPSTLFFFFAIVRHSLFIILSFMLLLSPICFVTPFNCSCCKYKETRGDFALYISCDACSRTCPVMIVTPRFSLLLML